MKVAILSAGIPSRKYPMNGIFAYDQAKALVKVGAEVHFLSLDMRSFRRRRKWGYSCGVKDGIRWYNYSIPIGPLFGIVRLVEKKIVPYLYKKAFGKSNSPDIIHAHFGEMGMVANVLKVKYGIPYVLTEHTSFMNNKILPLKVIKRMGYGYSHADAVIAVSSLLSQSIKDKTGSDSVVIPNIIDCHVFLPKEKPNDKGFRIVTTAILSKRKRVNLLLEAINDLQSILNDIHIDIIGDGVESESLKEYAKDHFPEGMYTFWGFLKREEASNIYKNSDCFILPSSLETFGVVYVEAMAVGLPVIATRCGGPEDFVDSQNGILIDVDNLSQLKDAIVYMYHNHSKYNHQAIRNSVINKFSPEVVANKVLSVYNIVSNKQ